MASKKNDTSEAIETNQGNSFPLQNHSRIKIPQLKFNVYFATTPSEYLKYYYYFKTFKYAVFKQTFRLKLNFKVW